MALSCQALLRNTHCAAAWLLSQLHRSSTAPKQAGRLPALPMPLLPAGPSALKHPGAGTRAACCSTAPQRAWVLHIPQRVSWALSASRVLIIQEKSCNSAAMMQRAQPELLQHCQPFALVPKIFESKLVSSLPQLFGMRDEII